MGTFAVKGQIRSSGQDAVEVSEENFFLGNVNFHAEIITDGGLSDTIKADYDAILNVKTETKTQKDEAKAKSAEKAGITEEKKEEAVAEPAAEASAEGSSALVGSVFAAVATMVTLINWSSSIYW